MIKKHVFFLLTLALLTFTISCKKDQQTISPNSNLPTSPPSCQLTSKIIGHPNATNGQSFHYFYNEDDFIETIERIQWGRYTSNGEPKKWIDTSHLFFEYEDNKAIRATRTSSHNKWFFEYEYDNELLVKTTVLYSDLTVQEYNLYKYDDEDRLIEVIDSTDKINFRYTMKYDNDNLNVLDKEILWSNPPKKAKYIFTNFDDQKNFASAIKGLPITFKWFNNFNSYSSTSPNNYQLQSYFAPIESDVSFSTPSVSECTYVYNNQDYPILINYNGCDVILEYENCE